MHQEHRKLVAALKRERARRKALHARLRFHAQSQMAGERMRRARLVMKQRVRVARANAEQARRRAAARRRPVRR